MTALTPTPRFVSLSPGAGTTVLAYDFELTLEAGLAVTLVRAGASADLVLGVDFSFPGGIGDDTGGTLTLAVASLAGDVYQLVGALPEQRLSDFIGSQKFASAKMNADLDALTIIAQEHRRDIARGWKSPYGSAGGQITAGAAGELMQTDDAGNLVSSGENVTSILGSTAQALAQAVIAAARAADAAASAAGAAGSADASAGSAAAAAVSEANAAQFASGGAVLLNWHGAGSVVRSVQGILSDKFPSPRDWDTGAGKQANDSTAALVAAIAIGYPVDLSDYSPDRTGGYYNFSSTLTFAQAQSGLIGRGAQHSTAAFRGTRLVWTGVAGGKMVRVPTICHAPKIEGITFDCNHLADTGLHLDAGAGESIQMPYLRDLNFRGYRRAGLILGADDVAVSRNGQFQHITAVQLSFWGGAAIDSVNTKQVPITAAAPGIISWIGHGKAIGDPVVLTNVGGALPAAYTAGRTYYIATSGFSVDQFALSTTSDGANPITTADTGTGTHRASFGTARGVILNAQNAEILTAIGFYFDPFTFFGGGVYTPHKNHFRILGGDLHIAGGMVSTRAIDWAIDLSNATASLMVPHWKSEDIRLINMPSTTTAGGASILQGIDHRSGHASGLEDVVVINYQGDYSTLIQDSRFTGNVRIGATVDKQVRLNQVEYRAGISATGSTVYTTPYNAKLDVEEEVGIRKLWNSNASEQWNDAANALLYKNDRGSLSKVKSIGSSGIKGENLGAVMVASGASATSAVTISNGTPAVISWVAHGLTAGRHVVFTTTGGLPAGLVAGTSYYVLAAGLATDSFEVSLTPGGAAIATTTAGTGVHTATADAKIFAAALTAEPDTAWRASGKPCAIAKTGTPPAGAYNCLLVTRGTAVIQGLLEAEPGAGASVTFSVGMFRS
ncbi:hypothetical protein [Mesorhizobium sp. M1399]|uniref:hypothetical protein n=1 Tax=Mesorhizobium sp. M1399 TaxID=2957096 RepID=UPI00333514B7